MEQQDSATKVLELIEQQYKLRDELFKCATDMRDLYDSAMEQLTDDIVDVDYSGYQLRLQLAMQLTTQLSDVTKMLQRKVESEKKKYELCDL